MGKRWNKTFPGCFFESDKTLSSAITPGQTGNEGVLRVPQSSSIIKTSPSDCLVPYPGHSVGESYSYAEKSSSSYDSHLHWQLWHHVRAMLICFFSILLIFEESHEAYDVIEAAHLQASQNKMR